MSELRRIRQDRRMTVSTLGVRAHISPQQIHNIESGRTVRPREETVWSLADALGVEPAAIDPCAREAA